MSILHRTFRFPLIVTSLLVTAHRLPAPIQEVSESPTPAPAVSAPARSKATPSKSKAIEPKPNTKSDPKPSAPPVIRKSTVTSKPDHTNRGHQFEGVWKTAPRADSSYTLIINGDSRAVLAVELTFTLSGANNGNDLLVSRRHRYWRDLPEQFNSAPELHSMYSSESKETHTTDSQIVVVWSQAKLVDWRPKSIPKKAMLTIASDPFRTERREVFTLQGINFAILLLGSLFFIFKESAVQPVSPVAKAPALGDLMIESEPVGAAVSLDQGPQMNAPHTFENVTFGTHRLKVTLEGYLPIEQELRFDGAGVPKIVLQPKPKPSEEIGKLSIRSDPPGALIRLDGALPQSPPDTFTNVKFGEHHLTAALEGFESKEESLPVSGEMNTDIVLKLTPVALTSREDPLQALADERKVYEADRDWPKYRGVSLQLVRQLTAEGEPASKERREMLGSVIEGLRTKGPALTPDEFRAYEKNFKYAAKLDLVPAILVVADNLRLRDSSEAFDWYSYAAEVKRVPYAMTKIAWLYWLGECGRHADKGEGFKWFKLAQAAGDTDAGVIVGKCYLRGEGTTKDENAGIQILLPLAEAGVATAKTLIGQCYYSGCGQFAALPQKERDRKAKTFYEEAIDAGDWQACGHLGVMYEVGQGVPKDWQQAAKLYLQGVEHENPICMYYYAVAIELHGTELMKLLGRQDKAETYYAKAAAASVTQARDWCNKHNVKY